jgi:hypothetical protein
MTTATNGSAPTTEQLVSLIAALDDAALAVEVAIDDPEDVPAGLLVALALDLTRMVATLTTHAEGLETAARRARKERRLRERKT